MRWLLVAGCLSFFGCSSLSAATTAANIAHDSLAVSRTVIEEVCIPAYKAAQTPADLARVDASCLPASNAYKAARVAWLAAVAAILAASRSGDEAALRAAIDRLAKAGAELAKSLEGL